jgi:porin
VAPASGIVPPAIFGAIGTVILPPMAATRMVYDPKNALNRTGFEDPFQEGVTVNGNIQVDTHWFQRSGKHILTAA